MRLRIPSFVVLTSLMTAVAVADVHTVAVAVEPAQDLQAIVVVSGETVQAVSVRNGTIRVPAALPLPWSLGMTRFEAAPYTRADLDGKRPWTIRELGGVEGRVERRETSTPERFVFVLHGVESDQLIERELAVDDRGAFRVALPAGTYHGAIVGNTSATRIRSGIVVRPGRQTDVGAIAVEPTVPVSVRVLDARSGKPLPGARVVWDPPGDVLNAAVLRKLYARRWSGTTDRRGIAEFPSIGPVPHSVRWRVSSKEYAPAPTARVQIREPRRIALPDVRLRQEPSVMIRVTFPRRDEEDLAHCTLVAGEIRDPHSPRYHSVARRPLREGETRVQFSSYGKKRLWIENREKKTIFYRDIEVTEETTLVDLELRPVEVHGRVTQRGKGAAETLVTLADPHNAKVVLARTSTDDRGDYRFRTWQSGQLFLYTIPPRKRSGRKVGAARARVDVADRSDVEVNLEVPSAGFTIRVVDAEGGDPVRARVDIRARFDSGGGIMSMEDTDADGILHVSGFERGRAKLHVKANGYRAADLEIVIDPDAPEATVRLEPAGAVSGRVVNVHGAPVAGAVILGGYPDEHDVQSFYRAATDAEGRFALDTAPPRGTTFYVVAAGYALATTSLSIERPATVVLYPPSSFVVSLRENNKPPEKIFLVMAAPRGDGFIPLAVFEELAEMSGMTLYQLCGSSVDGDVILPEFLGPGTYDLHIARRGGNSFVYERIGAITTPLQRNTVLTIAGN